ncbi:MAG: ABC transporter ATP-binding protein [Patescibacteria group bacterium]
MAQQTKKFKQLSRKELLSGLAIMYRYVALHKKNLRFLIILAVVSAALGPISPYFAGKIIDSMLAPGVTTSLFGITMFTIIWWIILWFAIRATEEVLAWQRSKRRQILRLQVEADCYKQGFAHLLSMPMSYHKTNKIGETARRIEKAAGWLYEQIGIIFVDLAPRFLSVFFVFFLAFKLNSYLSFLLVLSVILYAIISWRVMAQIRYFQKKGQDSYRKAWGYFYDSLTNVQSVKQAVAEDHENKTVVTMFEKAVGYYAKYMHVYSNAGFSQGLIIAIAQLGIYAIAIYFVWNHKMTIGEVAVFTAYSAMIFTPFVNLAENWQTLQTGILALEDAEKILQTPSEDYEPDNAISLKKMQGSIVFKNVSFSYGKKKDTTIKNMSFRIAPGETVALVGESGVGKSTLIDLISLYSRPQHGVIEIDGVDSTKLNLKDIRSQIAIVPQEVLLFNDTVKNNIKYGSFTAKEKEVIEATKKAAAHEFIMKFPKQYNQVVGERGIKLSGGQKQRIAIARAILRDPRILILDEPTSALDATSERAIAQALDILMKGRTTFIIAHRLATVRKADKIIVLKDGRIAEVGRHQELIKNKKGLYRKFYELQKL